MSQLLRPWALVTLLLALACERRAEVAATRADPNPNGSSELAWLMRDMQAQGRAWRDAISGGQELGGYPAAFDRLTTATPTDAAIKNETFDPLAAEFLTRTRELVQAPAEGRRAAYGRWVEGCLSCHATMCEGPVPAIEAMRL